MINFSRSGKQVKASIKFKSGEVKTNLLFYWDCESDVTAEALSEKMQKMFEKSVEREIKTAYEAGYKAGKQHKTKRTWFHSVLTHINESLPDWKIND